MFLHSLHGHLCGFQVLMENTFLENTLKSLIFVSCSFHIDQTHRSKCFTEIKFQNVINKE